VALNLTNIYSQIDQWNFLIECLHELKVATL
jgi:hypothetical protein